MATMVPLVEITTKTPPPHWEAEPQVTGTTHTIRIDTAALEADLSRAVSGEVRFSPGDRGMYASDAGNYRMVPLGVVLPRNAQDVVEAVAACRRHGAPCHGRGGGTGIPGQTVNSGVLFDFSKYMNRIVEVDAENKRARVQPGIILDTLRDAAEKHHLTFGPDPATHSRCTLGGMIGNNSCGPHSVMAGRTSDNIEELDVLTYDGTRMRVGRTSDEEIRGIVAEGGRRGEIYGRLRALRDRYADMIRKSFPDIPRRVSGYNLPSLLPENGFDVARALVGSEGTCVFVLEATARLVYSPPVRVVLVLGYPDIFAAGDHVSEVLPYGPIALEAMDETLIDDMRKKGVHPKHLEVLPKGCGWLLAEFGGDTPQEADAKARTAMEGLKQSQHPPAMSLLDDPKQQKFLWGLREEGLGATARVPGEPDNHEGWEDSAVPPEKVGSYLRDLQKLFDKYEYSGALYGHFGQGCVHTRLTFDLETAGGIAKFRSFLGDAADLVHNYGGSLSGEHGDGQARAEILPRMFPPEIMEAFREFKSIWDPEWKMNPGKLIEPYRVDENLRLGTHFEIREPQTHFEYPDDRHSFAYASERCVGAGVCRRLGEGTMCPSFMVTREEKHSTRGRARLLNEMLRGEVVKGGWKDEGVFDALDLCLSCKGCKGECPVSVDMATYKAEFLSHYYEGRLMPRTAYMMGRIHDWARLAALMPGLVNFLTHAPVLRSIAKRAAGIHSGRTIPEFAPQTFKAWFRERRIAGPKQRARGKVILWPDTFNNHFHTGTAQAAVEVLEAAGFDVNVPKPDLCCGRPLYDWGMLDSAKGLLRKTLDTLAEPIEEGVPVVVLEPSCASVFRDELHSFFPNDANARRLKAQTYLLSEFLEERAQHFELPRIERKVLLHGHCHHKALWKMDAEEAVLKKMGADCEAPETGCCGMAGAFGFETEHYDVSMKCGERVLLPAVRAVPKDTVVVSDGFSCREQIRQTTDREAMHLSEVIRMALDGGAHRATGAYPERRRPKPARGPAGAARIAAIAGAGALIAAGAWIGVRKLRAR